MTLLSRSVHACQTYVRTAKAPGLDGLPGGCFKVAGKPSPNTPKQTTMMTLENLIRGACLLLCLLPRVQGDGCANTKTFDLPVINMCEERNWTLGRVYIAVTSDNMGNNTGCVCVIRSKTPGNDLATVFFSKANDSDGTRCTESQIQTNPVSDFATSQIQNFTCTTPLDSTSYTGSTTDDVTITLTRPDTSVGVSYCILVHFNRYTENDTEISCQSGVTPPTPSATTSTSTTPSTTTASTVPTTTPTTTTTSSTTSTASTSSTTPSNTTSTTTTSTSLPSTAVPTPSTSPPTSTPSTVTSSSSSATSPPTSPMSSTTSGGENTSTTASGLQATEIPDSRVAAIAGGVSGAVVLIIIVIIIIVVVCKRRRRREKTLLQRQSTVENQGHFNPGLEEDLYNPHYSFAEVLAMGTDRPDSIAPPGGNTASSQDTGSLDGLLAASSNQSELQGDPARDNGAVSIDATAGSAVMKMDADKAQPPNPGGDVYAVVSKPRQPVPPKPRPDKPPKPAGLSTSSRGADVTTPVGGDVYAVVDRSRSKGGNEEKESCLPSAEATPSPPPADSSPSLVYADLEELKAEGRRPSPPRPPPEKAQETEYAVIDHVATARFGKEA